MEAKKSFFLEVVLPSVGLPEKDTYNLGEVAKILGLTRRQLFNKIKAGTLGFDIVSKSKSNRRIYKKSLIDYFEEALER